VRLIRHHELRLFRQPVGVGVRHVRPGARV
jgi:hypothetical protein